MTIPRKSHMRILAAVMLMAGFCAVSSGAALAGTNMSGSAWASTDLSGSVWTGTEENGNELTGAEGNGHGMAGVDTLAVVPCGEVPLDGDTTDAGTIEDCEDELLPTHWDTGNNWDDESKLPSIDDSLAYLEHDSSRGSSVSWVSILPPLAAIAIALLFRQVLLALFIGVWMGAWLAAGAGFGAVFTSFFTAATDYVVPSVADPDHVSILIFTLLIGGMVGIIGANGGTRGVVRALTGWITTRRRAQVTTTGLGYIIFFDDFANTMIVGSTMRPLTDRFRISRAKLAYLVDSTAAPVAIVALISTWIGAVMGYIREAESAIAGYSESAYLIFLNSLPYNFYAFLAIIFVLIIAFSGRDFGPMRRAEERARSGSDTSAVSGEEDGPTGEEETATGQEESGTGEDGESGTDEPGDESSGDHEKTVHWLYAMVPILALLTVTLGGLWVTGEGDTLQEIVGSADSYAALVWGSVFSVFLAGFMTLVGRLLPVGEMLKGMFRGMNVMFEGLLILVLAWSLGMVTLELDTAGYLVSLLEGFLSPDWLPVLIFVLSAVTSFATGSSWGTMGILMPLVLPLTWSLSVAAGLDPASTQTLIYASVSAVLAGAVWGDHCSPISDTTILSSLASRCDHVAHVNTQLPYALVVGVISVAALIASAVAGLPVWVIYPVAIALMVGIVYRFGTATG